MSTYIQLKCYTFSTLFSLKGAESLSFQVALVEHSLSPPFKRYLSRFVVERKLEAPPIEHRFQLTHHKWPKGPETLQALPWR